MGNLSSSIVGPETSCSNIDAVQGFNKGVAAALGDIKFIIFSLFAVSSANVFVENLKNHDGCFKVTFLDHTLIDLSLGSGKFWSDVWQILFNIRMALITFLFVMAVNGGFYEVKGL